MAEPLRPHDDPLEQELRGWLRERDSGPAPVRLRVRAGAVAREAVPLRSRWASWRPVAGFAAALVVLFLLTAVAALRGTIGSIGVGQSPSPSAGVDGSVVFRYGPWPRTGPVPALPLGDAGMVLLVLLPLLAAALLLGLLVAGSIRDASHLQSPQAVEQPRPGLSARKRAARMSGAFAAVALVVASVELFPYAGSTPLTYGSFFGAVPTSLGERQGTSGGADEVYVPFASGGEVRLLVSLRNEGHAPLTVTSFDLERFRAIQPAGPFIDSVEVLLPRGQSDVCDLYERGTSVPVGDICSEPFHPFELAPGGSETVLALVLHLVECPAAAPGPTVGPPAATGVETLPTTGYVTMGLLPFRYSMLGVERETDVRMWISVGLVFGSREVTCT
jgi:hypothetical protein